MSCRLAARSSCVTILCLVTVEFKTCGSMQGGVWSSENCEAALCITDGRLNAESYEYQTDPGPESGYTASRKGTTVWYL